MAATAIPVDALPSLNPATGETLGHFEKTLPFKLPQLMSVARVEQTSWAKVPIGERCRLLKRLRGQILSSREALADAVVRESGKPRIEAFFADLFVALDAAE